MKASLRFFAFLLLFITSCGPQVPSPKSGYSIGVDPSWYPLRIAGQERNVLAFSIELLVEIAKKESLDLSIQNRSWDNLLWGLREHKYSGMLSPMKPYSFYKKDYTFSAPYLKTGPVIVAPSRSGITSLKKLKGREVGVVNGSSAALLLQSVPGIMLKGYANIPQLFEGLSRVEVNAIAAEILIAQKFLEDLYADKFTMVTGPISEEGLRLVTLEGKAPDLVSKFDRGLEAMKKSGRYLELLEKWGLSPDAKVPENLDKKARSFLSKFL